TMADSAAGSQPRARSLRSASRRPKPQSTSTREVNAPSSVSTSSALPSLPLPRLAKRKPASLLLQLLVQQGQDLGRRVTVEAGDGLALAIEHRDHRAVSGGFGLQLELLRDLLFLLEAEHP